MGARARLRDLRDRAGVGPARAGRARAQRLGRAADRAGRPAWARRPRRAPTRRSRSPSRCSRRARSAASALAFQFASTNLVWELGLVLWVLIGWQFTVAEYVGGIVMIVLMTRAAAAVRQPPARGAGARARAARRQRPPAPRGRRAAELARAATSTGRVVRRRAQLPRRLADAVEGDHDRVPAGRVRRAARQRLLRVAVRPPRAGADPHDRERDRSAR